MDENSIDKAGGSTDGGGEIQRERGIEENRSRRRVVWPKLYITLSSKEKEEDFMAMKGCKPPHRPKKRAKIIQRTLLVSLLLLLLQYYFLTVKGKLGIHFFRIGVFFTQYFLFPSIS